MKRQLAEKLNRSLLTALVSVRRRREPRAREAPGREGSMAGMMLGSFAVYSG